MPEYGYQLALPCFPSCYEWIPELTEDGKMRGRVEEAHSHYVYGFVYKDSPSAIRKKFFKLAFASPFPLPVLVIGILRIAYRICALLVGDFAITGYHKAYASWELARQKWSIEQIGSCPRTLSLFARVVGHTAWQLTKNIAKIVTLPFAITALFFIALYGIVANPLDARHLFATIEHAWSRDKLDHQPGVIGGLQLLVGEYLAGCMLPKHVFDERNLYLFTTSYYKYSELNRVRNAIYLFKENYTFLINEKLPVDDTIQQLEKLAVSIRECYHQIKEEHLEEEKQKIRNRLEEFRNCVNGMIKQTNTIRTSRLAMIEAQIKETNT